MKIIHYIPSIDRDSGGTAVYMQLLGNALGRLVDLHIITHLSQNQLTIKNCHIHNIAPVAHYIKMYKQLKKLLLEIKPDVLHVNGCWYLGCAVAQDIAQKIGYKVVLSPHGMLEPRILHRHYWTKKLPALMLYQKKAVKNADCIHATSESESNNLLQLGWNQHISIIANGVNIEDIEMRTSWQRTKKILFLGRIHPIKGITFLIEALAKVEDGIQCLIAGVGEDSYVEKLKYLALKKGVANRVNFIGGAYGDEKWKLYKEVDVFVLPTYSENFGIVVAEALASGTPVITTTGAPWNDLNTERCGWWIEIGTEPLVKALNECTSLSEDEMKRLGINGRQLVERKYSTAAIASNFVILYNRILGEEEKPLFVCC